MLGDSICVAQFFKGLILTFHFKVFLFFTFTFNRNWMDILEEEMVYLNSYFSGFLQK